VFGKMQNYDQSDGGTEDEVVSTTSEPSDQDYDEGEQDDEYTDDRDRTAYGAHSFSSDQIVPKLATLLNGPQWQPPNPRTRRAARVDYNEKKLAQTPAKKAKQASKVCMKYNSRERFNFCNEAAGVQQIARYSRPTHQRAL
jgi:hypothetical protein